MTTIKLKNGSGAPTSGDLVQGEPALDLTNKRLYTEDSGGSVIEVGTNPTSVTTGTITGSGDMAIDTNTLFVDVSANAVGIGTTSPAYKAQISDSGNTVLSVTSGDSSSASLYLGDSVATRGRLTYDNSDDSLAVYTDNNERIRVDSSGNVGIGTSDPNAGLEVLKSGGGKIRISETADRYVEILGYAEGTANGSTMAFQTIETGTSTSTERMRIDSSGKVGIGEISPAAALHVKTSTNTPLLLESTIASGGYAEFQLGASGATIGYLGSAGGIVASGAIADLAVRAQSNLTFATGGSTERVRIDSSGNLCLNSNGSIAALDGVTGLQIGNSSASNAGIALENSSRGYLMYTNGSSLSFWDSTDNSERMQIDSSGNVLVSKSSLDVGTVGLELRDDGLLAATRSGSNVAVFRRLSDEGSIVDFQNSSGSTIGSIIIENSTLQIGTSNTNLAFSDANDAFYVVNAAGGGRDNSHDLGKSDVRFDDIYATNGTIQTSDRNEKQDIEALSDAEQRVAVAAKGLLRKFRWIDSVEEKGDEARIHFGIIAQDLQDAFTAEGLDAGRYAMFTSTTWTDEETGEERTRMGVRYSELLAFIIAAI